MLSKKTLVDLQQTFLELVCVSIYLATNFSRGSAILLDNEKEEVTLVELER